MAETKKAADEKATDTKAADTKAADQRAADAKAPAGEPKLTFHGATAHTENTATIPVDQADPASEKDPRKDNELVGVDLETTPVPMTDEAGQAAIEAQRATERAQAKEAYLSDSAENKG